MQKLTQKQNHLTSTPNAKKVENKVTPVRLAIALLIEHPHIVNVIDNSNILQHLNVPGVQLLNNLMYLCKSTPNIKTAQILEQYRDTTEGKQLSKLMCWQHNVESDAAEAVFEDSIEKLCDQFLQLKTEELLQKARLNQINADEKQELQMLLNNL